MANIKNLDITLISINMGDISPIINVYDKMLEDTNKYLKFKQVKILTDKHIFSDKYEICNIKGIHTISDLNMFSIKKLHEYFDTEFMLMIHPDGYIINPHLWKDEFLQYDYIGAPFENYNIGNGGFSLRSKYLCKYISKKYSNLEKLVYNEDGYYSNMPFTNNYNIKYPSLDVALSFSQEIIIDKHIEPFGCHGIRHEGFYYWTKKANKIYY